MKTLVISGSIRSRQRNLDIVSGIARKRCGIADYAEGINEYMKEKGPICNSDILSGAVALAMQEAGADVDVFSLTRLFPQKEMEISISGGELSDPDLMHTDTLDLHQEHLNSLIDAMKAASGIVLVSPVYFGDRSSVANKLLQISGMRQLLEDKVFGAVSVGAKRNGGQETTVIYCLLEALTQKALAVGNGPPTSQYGGTAVGGNKGTVADDEWGLTTAYGTGSRVAYVGRLMEAGRKSSRKRPLRILVLLTMDNQQGQLSHFLEDSLHKAQEELSDVEFVLYNVLDRTIYRCLGCDKCPSSGKLEAGEKPTVDKHASCIIDKQEDAIEDIHCELLKADGIIVAGLNVTSHEHLIYRYQVLIERMRFIRRDNFELTNRLLTAFTLNQVGGRVNALHTVKTVTSYIRHNTVIARPVEAYFEGDRVLCDGYDDLLRFVRLAGELARGREDVPPIRQEYSTKGIGGY